MKVVYNNEGCTGKVLAMKVGQKRLSEKLRLLYHEENITEIKENKTEMEILLIYE